MKPARTLILHIGRHKSGTSSLQHFLAGNRDRLSQQGVLYPHAGCDNRIAHHELAMQCNIRLSDGSGIDDILARMKAELAPHHERILLSSEAFQNLNDLSRLKDVCSALGLRDIQIVCYVREHLDYAMSGFRQLVQRQTIFITFDQYARRLGDMAPFLRRWKEFGDLSVAWFNRNTLKDGDVIADFCERISIDPADIPSSNKNPSIGGNLLVYKLAANRLKLPALSYATMHDLAEQHDRFREPFFVSETAAANLRATSDYNASLAAVLGSPEEKPMESHPSLPQPETINQDLKLIVQEKTTNELRQAMLNSSPWFDLAES